jgi:hypothetical protein
MTAETFYKATRPDGTSFFDSKTKWRVGRITRLARPDLGMGLCSNGVLHAANDPAMTLAGGSWPCRLFEVEPRGPMTKVVNCKVGATSWKVVRELSAWRALGPNGEQVAALIGRASRVTFAEAQQIDAARVAAWDAARWAAARDAAWGATRDAAWAAARAASDAARGATRDAAGAAAAAAAGAAAGLVVRDLISDEQYQLLAGPWLAVIGEP